MTSPITAAAIAVAALTVLTPACAPTTYDESLDTVAIAAGGATTTTLPSGSAAELLSELATEAKGLSAVMIAGGDAGAVAVRIRELWDAARDEVARDRPELLGDFEANVARCESAVQFRRAADADKAATNLDALVDAYVS